MKPLKKYTRNTGKKPPRFSHGFSRVFFFLLVYFWSVGRPTKNTPKNTVGKYTKMLRWNGPKRVSRMCCCTLAIVFTRIPDSYCLSVCLRACTIVHTLKMLMSLMSSKCRRLRTYLCAGYLSAIGILLLESSTVLLANASLSVKARPCQ